ncbi:GFA family protein [Aspergillus aculeatinus CBS 121060]|uniref:Uncharacterized protein n=1 Tax=Aspergillus aculeatinus CBS 121060 TaxID=1448322 RepID=A0ACD1H1U1_9EURO|nr:hypothetical protein BO66DRAFT_403744 [Aspergillus aculeatinus CBS 121060]RAH67552.1 hypothetical protein BO66DRAFT_403744 [Aspergillus aculeatinus CBS 121060]
MATYTGHCLCGGVKVTLNEQPPRSLRCFCRNCGRTGGGSSINYVLDEADVKFLATSTLTDFEDSQTESGNTVLRQFCGRCGSAIASCSPQFPGKILLKASLFDAISQPDSEVFTSRRPSWESPVESAQQK